MSLKACISLCVRLSLLLHPGVVTTLERPLGRKIGISGPLSRRDIVSLSARTGSTVRPGARRKLLGLTLIGLPLIGLNRSLVFNRSTFRRVEHIRKCDRLARALAREHVARRVN
jgi:hypothetical protein